VKIYIDMEMDWSDIRTIEMIASKVGLDPESTIKLLIRRGIESMVNQVPVKPDNSGKENKKKR